MKYSELEKLVRNAGCYDTKKQRAGHPLWYSPQTGMYFQMSNHGKQEVASGTLKAIKRAAGIQ
jgi:predicted RNA binding protein YcfA (HicA-like mRNA interferase family)